MEIAERSRELVPRLVVSGHLVEEQLDVILSPFGFTLRKLGAHKHLVRAGGSLPLGSLVGPLCCGKSNVTQVVDRLEAQGLVRRVPDPTDRRGVLAEITPEGRRRFESAAPALEAAERELTTCLTPEERQQLTDLLGRILESCERARLATPMVRPVETTPGSA
jgi:DNA-binding MarR family transcriptional regulator